MRAFGIWCCRNVLLGVYQLTRRHEYDVLYLNSAFSPYFTLLPLILRRIGASHPAAVIVAPRGEFSPGALALKRLKKTTFLRFARLVHLYDGVLWQASAPPEVRQIIRTMGRGLSRGSGVLSVPQIVLAPDLASNPEGGDDRAAKTRGSARIVFLSRITRMKNLSRALELIGQVEGDILFDIFGPIEDAAYWAECRQLMASLPPTVTATYRGEIRHERVPDLLRQYHALLLPTRGENFGHVIHEALSAGCPVLLSDQTPWRNLEASGAGWDLPLDDEAAWLEALASVVDADTARLQDVAGRCKSRG